MYPSVLKVCFCLFSVLNITTTQSLLNLQETCPKQKIWQSQEPSSLQQMSELAATTKCFEILSTTAKTEQLQ